MFQKLLDKMSAKHSYLHSPVDGLKLFYYMAQWVVAFNNGASGGKHEEGEIIWLWTIISSTKQEVAAWMVQSNKFWETEQDYGPLFTHSTAILHPQLQRLYTLAIDWLSAMVWANKPDNVKREDYLNYNILVYDCQGVREYFKLIHEHCKLLEKAV